MNHDHEKGELTIHHGINIARQGAAAHISCLGCGKAFPAVKHPVEDQWDSPEWEAHVKEMRDS